MLRLAGFPRTYLVSAACLAIFLIFFLLSFSHSDRSLSWSDRLRQGTGNPNARPNSLNSILNETLGFQKILVINLPSRSNNRDSISLAASLTGLKVQYVDGVTEFDEAHALPERIRPEEHKARKHSTYGSWRAHMNAIRTIVEENLTSALILEDDVDWDVRIKGQLQNFARASKLLVQPVQGTKDEHIDPYYPRRSRQDEVTHIEVDNPPRKITEPTTSPYGDASNWDVLWLGHCGTHLPHAESIQHPLARVLIPNDQTVLETQHFDPGYGAAQDLPSYPNHTRIVANARITVCNLAYGVSLPGAQNLLYQMGVVNMTSTTDGMIGSICDGKHGWTKQTCISTLPQLFHHHRPRALPHEFSENIRWGTRANLEKLIAGDRNYTDAFPDGETSRYFWKRNAKVNYEKYLREKAGLPPLATGSQKESDEGDEDKDEDADADADAEMVPKAKVQEPWKPQENSSRLALVKEAAL